VYFIEAKGQHKIKIGYSKDPEKRRKTFATGSSSKLTLIKKIVGDFKLENEIKARFEHIRIEDLDGKEWFHATKELTEYIEKLTPAP